MTLCHAMPEMLAHSLALGRRTIGVDVDWVLVDHLWPIDGEFTRKFIRELPCSVFLEPETNMGGVGGANWAVAQLGLADDDVLIGYDPDSNPLTDGWGKALVDVMSADPQLDYLSLMPVVHLLTHRWQFKVVRGHRVAWDDRPEMFGVTAWRGKFIKRGLPDHRLYGGVEGDMHALGHVNHYLYDFREGERAFPHPASYTQWKREHVAGTFPGNFDEFVRRVTT